MKPDPILEEVWRVKDQLAREANYDTHRFFEILRKWETDHPHPGRVVRSAKELRDLISDAEAERADSTASLLKDEPERGQG